MTKSILVTGSNGFLAKHLITRLKSLGYNPYGVTRQAYDLRNPTHIDSLFAHTGNPDIIFHLAAHVGGIQYNVDHPAQLFYDNVMMATQLIHKAAMVGAGKFVMCGSVCSYPSYPPMPTNERQLWTGYPEESNGSYGVSKLVALEQLKSYHKEYGLNFAYPIFANLYGPSDSGFTQPSKAHLIPSLIKKFVANPDKVMMFGKGELTRDFLFVEDAAEALIRLMDVDYSEPLNVATGEEISKLRLVSAIVELTNYKGIVEWDGNPDAGQLRRCYDIHEMKRILNWQPQTKIKDGLDKTIKWYKEQ